jgi:hypothetical protein
MLTRLSQTLVILALAGLSATSALAGPAGTTITLTKTAETTWTQVNTYDWEITKTPQSPDQVTYVILPGDTAQVGFTVKATRSGPQVLESNTPVAGEICIQNTGIRATQNLQLVDDLEVYDANLDAWVPAYPQFTILTSGEIAAGDTRCFNYSIELPIDRTKLYRNRVTAAIDNYLGYEGMKHEVDKIANVNIKVNIQDIRPSVTVRDTFQCAVGFECTPDWSDQLISDSQTFTYSVAVKNTGALCGETVTLSNTASLDYGDDSRARAPADSATATAIVYSGSCRND